MKSRNIYLLVISVILLTACSTVTSRNLVGLTNFELEEKDWNGLWFFPDDSNFIKIKVIDKKNGILKAAKIDEQDNNFKLDEIVIQIKKGKKSLYANVLEEKGEKAKDEYFWCKISNEKGKILYWFPSSERFLKAAELKKIKAIINNETDSVNLNGQDKDVSRESVILIDEPEKIIDMIEDGESNYFEWEHPIILIKYLNN